MPYKCILAFIIYKLDELIIQEIYIILNLTAFHNIYNIDEIQDLVIQVFFFRSLKTPNIACIRHFLKKGTLILDNSDLWPC